VQPDGTSHVSTSLAARVRAAVALGVDDRRRIVEDFFRAHPGRGAGPFGLGRAVIDFQDWEIRSGRLAETGSPWWRGVNGLLVLDLRAAGTGERSAARPAGPVAAWIAYAHSSDDHHQQLLWRAHQRSLHEALTACAPLLRSEPPAERFFARLVVGVVDHAASESHPTDTGELAELTAEHYPSSYPISDDELERLDETFGSLARTRPSSL
jgi:hypothetical protein